MILLYMFSFTSATNTCSVGQFLSSSDPSTCMSCQAGYYCPLLDANNPETGTTQTGCPPGTYMLYTGATSVNDCLKCEIGTYAPGYSYTVCPKCPHGTFCDAKGLGDAKQCPLGSYQPNEGATSINDCLTCPAGYTCTDPTQTPIPISAVSSSGNVTSTQISFSTIKSLTSSIVIPARLLNDAADTTVTTSCVPVTCIPTSCIPISNFTTFAVATPTFTTFTVTTPTFTTFTVTTPTFTTFTVTTPTFTTFTVTIPTITITCPPTTCVPQPCITASTGKNYFDHSELFS